MANPKWWIKSSRSQAVQNCVELANTLDCIRDSKDLDGPVLEVDVVAFIRAVKAGRFDR
ncbi:DUF397 domain-containing protein [Saccharopolyspora sp. 5N708]|uniref:DUF397 domain-containing protein n=1 Tax=Saccharopolyspora sp. 5N708 TaxID=3457424 RepID=UPI003FCFAB59